MEEKIRKELSTDEVKPDLRGLKRERQASLPPGDSAAGKPSIHCTIANLSIQIGEQIWNGERVI